MLEVLFMKKLVSLLLCVIMIFSCSISVFAYGGEVKIPSGDIGTLCTYEREIIDSKDKTYHGWIDWTECGQFRKSAIKSGRLKKGSMCGLKNVATTDNRLMIATVANIGNKLPVSVGDYLDVYFTDGTLWQCIVGDIKEDGVNSIWGHNKGQSVVEIIYWDYSHCGNVEGKKISKIQSVGSYWDKNSQKPVTVKVGYFNIKTGSYGNAFIDGNNRTMVPLRSFAESAGCTVAWDGKTKKITLTQAGGLGAVVEFTVGKSEYKVKPSSLGNYVKKSMDTAPLICEDRTYIPLRYAAEALGYKVNWNSGSKTATCSESGLGF